MPRGRRTNSDVKKEAIKEFLIKNENSEKSITVEKQEDGYTIFLSHTTVSGEFVKLYVPSFSEDGSEFNMNFSEEDEFDMATSFLASITELSEKLNRFFGIEE